MSLTPLHLNPRTLSVPRASDGRWYSDGRVDVSISLDGPESLTWGVPTTTADGGTLEGSLTYEMATKSDGVWAGPEVVSGTESDGKYTVQTSEIDLFAEPGEYEVYVRARSDADSTLVSAWSDPITVTFEETTDA